MRLIRFFSDGEVHLGVRQQDSVVDATSAARHYWSREVASPTAFMAADGLEQLAALCRRAQEDQRFLLPDGGLRLDAPIRDVPKLLALASNYRAHAIEAGLAAIPESGLLTPQVFLKPASTAINAPGAAVAIRPNNVFVDWEIELAVVIGRGGRDIPAAEAMSHVFGYSVINDISERKFNARLENRKLREADPFFDWLLGKWFDGHAPLGPEIVTCDEIPDPHQLGIRLWVNDKLMQNSNTREMVFQIPESIRYISSVMTLEPGDVIAMGTPDGVGMARGIALQPGDRMRGEIDRIGVLENYVAGVE